ncbi:MAG TPA: urate oxidase, partial [Spirochaetia bacterium]
SADETPWERIPVDGAAHPHAFTRAGWAARTATVHAARGARPRVTGGIAGLEVIKTTRSGFSGFLKDAYTTLPETEDRIFATRIDASWEYADAAVVPADAAERGRDVVLRVFAEHDSKSVQQTIYVMGRALLDALPEIVSVSLTMPNQHRILANLAPFGLANANEIFVATREPYGLIKGTVARE